MASPVSKYYMRTQHTLTQMIKKNMPQPLFFNQHDFFAAERQTDRPTDGQDWPNSEVTQPITCNNFFKQLKSQRSK